MSRQIIGPEILDQRYEFMQGKSVWYYIDLLNQGLRSNSVSPEGVIEITIKYNMDIDIIGQVKDFFYTTGWDDIRVTLTGNADTLYGETIFKFYPPEEDLKRLIKKIEKLL